MRVGVFAPLLELIRVSPETAWAELRDDAVEIRFGYVDALIRYDEISLVERRSWPILYGIGLRLGPDRSLGYVGAGGEAVWLKLKHPRDLAIGPWGLKMERDRVALALEDGPAFEVALKARIKYSNE